MIVAGAGIFAIVQQATPISRNRSCHRLSPSPQLPLPRPRRRPPPPALRRQASGATDRCKAARDCRRLRRAVRCGREGRRRSADTRLRVAAPVALVRDEGIARAGASCAGRTNIVRRVRAFECSASDSRTRIAWIGSEAKQGRNNRAHGGAEGAAAELVDRRHAATLLAPIGQRISQ